MQSNNIILVLLGVIGLSSLIAGMSYTKEEWSGAVGMPQLKSIGSLSAVPSNGMLKGGMAGTAPVAYNIDYNPLSRIQAKPQQIDMYRPMSRPYNSKSEVEMLGSSANTDFPFVSKPGYQQSTPLTSPDVKLGPMEKYKPTTLSNMGITDAYKNNCNNTTVEKYQQSPAAGFMEPRMTVDNQNPGANFSAGNYSQVAMNKPCSGTINNDKLSVGNTTAFNATGTDQNVQVFENLMYSNIKPGRTRRNGVTDYLRGDLPVCIEPNHKGWFNAPAKPTDLFSGSLAQMGGHSESTITMDNFMQSYGALPNPYIQATSMPNGQQTIPQMMATLQPVNRALSAVSFN